MDGGRIGRGGCERGSAISFLTLRNRESGLRFIYADVIAKGLAINAYKASDLTSHGPSARWNLAQLMVP